MRPWPPRSRTLRRSTAVGWKWVLGAPSRRAAGRGPPGREHVRGCRAWGRARVAVGQFCLKDRCAHAGQTRPRRDTRDATRSLHDLFTVTLKPTIPLPEWPRQKLPAPPSPVQEPRIRVPRSALPTLAVGVGCRTPPSPLGVAQTRCWRQAGRRWQVDPALPSRLLTAGHASRVSLALPSNGWRLVAGRASQVDPALPSRLLMAGQASQVVLALPSNGWRLARRRRSTQPSPVSLP